MGDDEWDESQQEYAYVDDQRPAEADLPDSDELPPGFVGPTGGRGPDDEDPPES